MSFRRALGISAFLALLPLSNGETQVRSLTLGITMNCPYGLAG